MKIRNGFVSNSSSSSFAIPLQFLTDEQKEMLLHIDDSKDVKKKLADITSSEEFLNPVNNYQRNEEYHKIYQDMLDADDWHDSGWSTDIEPKGIFLIGSTIMWNGTIERFMEKIGIDINCLEITNGGHCTTRMPNNAEALKLFAKRREEDIEDFKELQQSEDAFDKIIVINMTQNGRLQDNPYSLKDEEFKDYGYGEVRFASEDGYDYIKKLKSD